MACCIAVFEGMPSAGAQGSLLGSAHDVDMIGLGRDPLVMFAHGSETAVEGTSWTAFERFGEMCRHWGAGDVVERRAAAVGIVDSP